MSRKSNNRHDRFFTAVISLLCVCAVVLVLAIVVQSGLNSQDEVAVQAMADDPASTHEPLTVVSIDSQITPTPDPLESTPTPAPTQEPFELLPVYSKADTRERVIAITLDDCSNLEALQYAAKAAVYYDAKLTLLPVATHLLQQKNMEALQYCVFNLGFQVENRTLTNSTLYGLNDFNMAKEIWSADLAVDYALNRDYSMHLLRPKGGQGLDDPRTHAYLKQLGYDGFLTWTVSGTDTGVEKLKSSLEPGNIYLFNCTKKDVVKLAGFMEFAKSRGYKIVTVNELLGFEENACTVPEDDLMSRTMPELADFTAPTTIYSEGDRSNGVYKLQVMLQKLGYLTDPDAATPSPVEGGTPAPTFFLDAVMATTGLADGVYGAGTSEAIIKVQAAYGLPCTGVATVETQQLILKEYEERFGTAEIETVTPAPTAAPVVTAPPVVTAVPVVTAAPTAEPVVTAQPAQ